VWRLRKNFTCALCLTGLLSPWLGKSVSGTRQVIFLIILGEAIIRLKNEVSLLSATSRKGGNTMPKPTAYVLYCSNIRCGSESWSTSNGGTIKTRRRQPMVYGGTKKVGVARVIWRNIMNPGDPIETGAYHFYFCPVCGREAAIHDRWGVNRLVV